MTTGQNTFRGKEEKAAPLTGVCCIANVLPVTSADEELNL